MRKAYEPWRFMHCCVKLDFGPPVCRDSCTSQEGMANAMGTSMHATADGTAGVKSLEPIVLQTTLATSITGYLERTLWAAVTPQLLCAAEGAPPAARDVAGDILCMLFATCGVCSPSTVGHLLRQVRDPHTLISYTIGVYVIVLSVKASTHSYLTQALIIMDRTCRGSRRNKQP